MLVYYPFFSFELKNKQTLPFLTLNKLCTSGSDDICSGRYMHYIFICTNNSIRAARKICKFKYGDAAITKFH